MTVSLTPTLDRYVRSKVESGRYESASDVVLESLRALQVRERVERRFWAGVQLKLDEARADEAAGRIVDGETAMAEILNEIDSGDRAPRRRKAAKR